MHLGEIAGRANKQLIVGSYPLGNPTLVPIVSSKRWIRKLIFPSAISGTWTEGIRKVSLLIQ